MPLILGRRSRSGEGVDGQQERSRRAASVLLVVPFGLLDYPCADTDLAPPSLAAFAVSLVLLARDLGLRPRPGLSFPLITLLLICNPFRQQVNQGQFNLLLLLLMTGVWTAERSDGRRSLARCWAWPPAFKRSRILLFCKFLLRAAGRLSHPGLRLSRCCHWSASQFSAQETYDSYLREVFPAMLYCIGTGGRTRRWRDLGEVV